MNLKAPCDYTVQSGWLYKKKETFVWDFRITNCQNIELFPNNQYLNLWFLYIEKLLTNYKSQVLHVILLSNIYIMLEK